MLSARLLASAVLLAASAAPALAQASHDPTAVKPGAYAVEPLHTQIEFGVSHLGFTTYYGRFSDARGTLTLDPAHPDAGKLMLMFPAGSVSTTSAKLNGELRGPEWFNAAKFPEIAFRSTAVTSTGPDSADVTGDLTLHGVTKPLTLHAKFVGAGANPIDHRYTVGFEARGELKRSDFGVSKYVPMVGDEVQLTLSGAFEKAE